ncbi:hypothetical protein B7463_g12633, partial [Scytalidium lignicola]
MTRGEAHQTKVHFKGKDEDFIVFVDDIEIARKWRKDKSIPLAQVVSSFQVFSTNKHGAQGPFDAASNATLENEFGTHKEEEVIKLVLEKGTIQETIEPERQGFKNDSQGAMANHS